MRMAILLIHRTVEQTTHHAEQIRQGDDDTNDRYNDLERILVPTPDDDHDLGDEIHGAWHTDGSHAGNDKTAGDEGHSIRKTSQRRDITRVCLIVAPPG